MMRKYTLKELRELVRLGMAENINSRDPKTITEPVEKIGYSSGVYGINGGLLQGKESGNYYAITARNTNLFYFF
ncbi:MAG: hypothetical protein ACLRPB_00795 [Lawsonibacter sp.]